MARTPAAVIAVAWHAERLESYADVQLECKYAFSYLRKIADDNLVHKKGFTINNTIVWWNELGDCPNPALCNSQKTRLNV